MNLRQKYKRAKQKLEYYEKQLDTRYVDYKYVTGNPIKLAAESIMDYPQYDRYLSYEVKELKDEIARNVRPYITVSSTFDPIRCKTIIRASITVLDMREVEC